MHGRDFAWLSQAPVGDAGLHRLLDIFGYGLGHLGIHLAGRNAVHANADTRLIPLPAPVINAVLFSNRITIIP